MELDGYLCTLKVKLKSGHMPLFSRKRSGTAHWSADYFQHLRSIHFALVAISLTGLVIGRTPNISELRIARHQLSQIEAFAQKPFSKWVDGLQAGVPDFNTAGSFGFAWQKQKYAGSVPQLIDVLQSEKYDCAGGYVKVNVIFPGKPAKNNSTEYIYVDMTEFAREFSYEHSTLQDFAKIWDRLECSEQTLYVVGYIGNYLLEWSPAAGVDGMWKGSYKKAAVISIGDYEPDIVRRHRKAIRFDFEGILQDAQTSQTYPVGFKLARDPFKRSAGSGLPEEGFLSAMSSGPVTLVFRPETSYHLPPGAEVESSLTLHVAASNIGVRPGHDLLQYAQSDWGCNGRFAECFAALVHVSDGKAAYTLNDLSNWIDSQISGNPPRDFEISGLKVSAEQLSRWGIIFVLILLFYFWLHLRELSPTIEMGDSGLHTAWVGLYPSIYANLLIWLSVTIGPLLFVIVVGLNSVHYEPPLRLFARNYWRELLLWVILPAALCSILSISSCIKIHALAKLSATARANESHRNKS